MKKYRFRLILILAFIALAGYYLYWTYSDIQYQTELDQRSGADSVTYYEEHEESIRDARAKRIKLGLDLQGGMYVTLEVDVAQMLEKMAKNKDERLREILQETEQENIESDEPFLEIFAGKFEDRDVRMSRYYGDIRDSNSEILSMLQDETAKAVDRAEEIINNRVNQYGVSESSIQRSGARRIIVELPGVSDEREVRSLIQETAQLEFMLFADPDLTMKKMERIDKLLLGQGVTAEDTTEVDVADTSAQPLPGVEEAPLADADQTAEGATEESIDETDTTQARLDSIRKANMTQEQQLAEFKKNTRFRRCLRSANRESMPPKRTNRVLLKSSSGMMFKIS